MRLPGKEGLSSNHKGLISEIAIITRLLQCGYIVLTSYGGAERYDIVIEDASKNFWRIQCKSASIDKKNTVLEFDTANHNVTGKKGIGVIIRANVNALHYIAKILIRFI